MTNTPEIKPTFKQKLKKAFDVKFIAIIVLGASYVGDKAWNTYNKGAELEFNQKIDDRFRHQMQNPMVLNQVLESPSIESFTQKSQEQIEMSIVHRIERDDSAKVSFVTFLGEQTGVRDEDVLSIVAKLLNDYQNGDLMTKDQVEELIRKRTISANF